MKEQEICNKIMAQMLENYTALFEWEHPRKENEKRPCEDLAQIILVKVSACIKIVLHPSLLFFGGGGFQVIAHGIKVVSWQVTR